MATVNLDTATRLDIVCRKGDSFLLELDFGKQMPAAEVDDNGFDGDYEFKVKSSTRSGTAVGNFTVNVTDSADDETDHVLRVEATSSDMTSNITAGLYVYDLQVTDHGTNSDPRKYVYEQVDGADRTVTLLYGTFKIVDDVNA